MKNQLALALALAIAPFAASAGELSYTFVEAGAAQLNFELPNDSDAQFDDVEASGFYLDGSVELGESLYLFGGYASGNDDVSVTIPGVGSATADLDLSQYNVGFGFHHGLSDRADLIAELSYVNSEVKSNGTDEHADDGRIAVGVRGLLADSFEGWVKGSYTDGLADNGAYDGEFGAIVGAQFKINQTWGITAEAEYGDTASLYTIGVRASF